MNFQSPVASDKPVSGWKSALPPARYLIGGGALVLVLGGFWFFTHADTAPPRRGSGAAPVKVATAVQRDMPVVEHTIGTVLANSSVQVTARVGGQLVQAFFREGQLVKTGDVLFQIDPRPYQAALDQATAQMARDQANLSNAQADAKRYATLFSQQAISIQQRDQTEALAKSDAALVEADKAAVETARLNLEYSRIRSPVNGKTGPMLVQPGNLVTASASVGASALVTINEIQPVKVSLSLPQSDLPRIQAQAKKNNLAVQIDQHNQGGGTMSAPVNFISNAVTATAGTIELRATFTNDDAALVPGQLVDATVALAQIPGAIVVPREAVNTGPASQFVYVVTPDGVAEQRDVTVLFDDGTNDAIQGAVHDGDTVIVDGQLRVVPGAKVSISRAGAQPAAGGERRGGRRGRGGRGRGGRRGAGAMGGD